MATQEQAQELFRLLDRDEDGIVSTEELYSTPLFHLVYGATRSLPPQLLENHDSDKDGNLTLEEFKKAVEAGLNTK